jgi:hypothetical protein
MTLWTARIKAEAEYKAAVREWKANPTQRNADRVKIKQRLLEGLQKWIAERGAV